MLLSHDPETNRRTRMRRWALPALTVLTAALMLFGLAGADRTVAAYTPSLTILPSPASVTCGSISAITVEVYDIFGYPAGNGTPVTFTTSYGYVTSPRYTNYGTAFALLTVPTKQSGVAIVTVSAVGLTVQKSITVTCAVPSTPPPVIPSFAPPPVQSQQPAPAAPAAPAASATQSVRAVDFAFQPNAFAARAGQTVAVTVSNGGAAQHTFTIDGMADTGLLNPGQSMTVQLTPAQAGNLLFYCRVHGASVMSGQVTVSP